MCVQFTSCVYGVWCVFNTINSLHVISYTRQRACTHQNYVVSNEELSLSKRTKIQNCRQLSTLWFPSITGSAVSINTSTFLKVEPKHISSQFSLLNPPENFWFSDVFRGVKMETLGINRFGYRTFWDVPFVTNELFSCFGLLAKCYNDSFAINDTGLN